MSIPRITCEGFRTSRNPCFNIFLCDVNYCSLKLPEISFCEDLGSPVGLGCFDHAFYRTWKNWPMFSNYQTKFLTRLSLNFCFHFIFLSLMSQIGLVLKDKVLEHSLNTNFRTWIKSFSYCFFPPYFWQQKDAKTIIVGATVLASKSSNHCQVWSVLGPDSKLKL